MPAYYIDETPYHNESELAIMMSLDACTTPSFEGRHFLDRVCLQGHKNSGPVDLILTGAVFHEEVTIQFLTLRKLMLNGVRFRKGINLRFNTVEHLGAQGVHISEYADFMDVTTPSANFANAKLPDDVWTTPGECLHQLLEVQRLLQFARSG